MVCLCAHHNITRMSDLWQNNQKFLELFSVKYRKPPMQFDIDLSSKLIWPNLLIHGLEQTNILYPYLTYFFESPFIMAFFICCLCLYVTLILMFRYFL